jgi:hypothetical protein
MQITYESRNVEVQWDSIKKYVLGTEWFSGQRWEESKKPTDYTGNDQQREEMKEMEE